MILGVLSDTHLRPRGGISGSSSIQEIIEDDNLNPLYTVLEEYFSDVDAVIHAGDITDTSLIRMLGRFGEVYAVSGNMDPHSVRSVLPGKRIVKINGYNIGIYHGHGGPDGLSHKVRQQFKGEKLDCIVFGHSHRPYDRVEEGVLMFNPGSVMDSRNERKRSLGLLHLEESIRGEHIFID